MVFNVPRFKNNEILSEGQLYALAQLSLEYFRWNSIADKQYGFFTPPQVDRKQSNYLWNQFHFEGETLHISNLYLISQQGYPFILPGNITLDKIGNTLYAVADFAEDSQSYSDNGYEISFEWDLPKIDSPVEDREPFVINLGTVIESEGKRIFSLNPPIVFLDSTSSLWKLALNLKEIIYTYIQELVKHSRKNTVDRSELLQRCDRLALLSSNTKTDTFVKDARLVLESVRGFYHRLIYHNTSQDNSRKHLTGRALEEDLIQTKGNIVKPEIFNPIDDCWRICHDASSYTGQDGLNLVQKLVELFSSNSSLITYLQIAKKSTNLIPLSKGYPQNFPPKRNLYRYELSNAYLTGQIIVEFSQKPINVGFVFSNQKDRPDSLPFFKKNSELLEADSKHHRYRLLGNLDRYLFIAAPIDTILRVEIDD